jgi:hypothetical protein
MFFCYGVGAVEIAMKLCILVRALFRCLFGVGRTDRQVSSNR